MELSYVIRVKLHLNRSSSNILEKKLLRLYQTLSVDHKKIKIRNRLLWFKYADLIWKIILETKN